VSDALQARDIYAVTDALGRSRVFVALLATLISRSDEGLEQESEMSLAWIEHEGERILPVFTGVAELLEWNPQARPLRAETAEAIAAALAEGAMGVLVNPARGGVSITGAAARSLALGYRLYPAWQDPAIEMALERALEGEPVATAFLKEPGAEDGVDLVVVLVMVPDTEVAIRVMEKLSADPEVTVRLERGIDLAVLPVLEG
jgi:hypothetical protein